MSVRCIEPIFWRHLYSLRLFAGGIWANEASNAAHITWREFNSNPNNNIFMRTCMHDHHESQWWHVDCLHPDPLILSQHLASATSLYLYPAPQCQQSIQHQQTLSQQVETIISIYYLYYLSSTLSTSITYMTPSLPRSSKAVSKAAVSCICILHNKHFRFSVLKAPFTQHLSICNSQF